MEKDEPIFWSPDGSEITQSMFGNEQQSRYKALQFYTKFPYIIKISYILCVILPIALIAFLVWITDKLENIITWVFYGFIPLFIFNEYILELQRNILLFVLCQKNNWAYNPKVDDKSPARFASFCPLVFDRGDTSYFEDQLWGSFREKDKIISFWKSKFCYPSDYESNSNYEDLRKNKSTINNVFVIKLPNQIPITFSLLKTNLLIRSDAYLKTESEEFNRTFRILSDDANAKAKIVTILSPSVQTRLIDFSKKYAIETIYFDYEMIIVLLKSDIWQIRYTNFFKKVAIDERDEAQFYSALKDMVQLPSEMVQFI